MIARIFFLIRHEIRLEFRQQHTLAGIALFALATVYLCYQAFNRIDDKVTWNALLWVIILFTAFSAVGKSFQHRRKGLRLYLYWTIKPGEYILAKILYNMALMCVMALLVIASYSLFLGNPLGADGIYEYLLGLLVGAIGFGSILTLIAAIAEQSQSGVGLTAVLGLPIVIPLILLLDEYNTNVMNQLPLAENGINLLFLVVLSSGIIALSYLLFPYLWRD